MDSKLIKFLLPGRSILLDPLLGGPPEFRLVLQAVLLGKLGQPAVAAGGIDTSGPPDLHLVFGAEPDRLTVCLGLVIGPVHAALELRAVPDPQHVSRLVHGDLERPAKEGPRLDFRVAHAVERPDADAPAQRRLPEDEVPAIR